MQPELLARWTKGIAYASSALVIIAVFILMFSFVPGNTRMARPSVMEPDRMMRDGWAEGAGGAPDNLRSPEGFSGATAPSLGMGVSQEMRKMVANDTLSNQAAESPASDRRVVQTGSLSLRVEDADWAAGEITRIATELRGNIQSSNLSDNGGGMKSGTITLKVPASRFGEALERVKKTGSLVLNEQINASDVTAEFVDLQARLKNKRDEETAFARILEAQAGKIQDILDVTRELSRVRGEIEQLQAQIKYLEEQTDMASLSVYLSEDPRVGQVDQWRPWQVLKDSINQFIRLAQNFGSGLIYFVIVVLPVLLIYALILWLLYRGAKKAYGKLKDRM